LELIYTSKFDTDLSFEVWNERPEDLDIVSLNQIHSDIVINIDKTTKLPDGDGLVTSEKSKCIGVRTADCVPIAIKGEKGIAIIHAGWKGIQKKILLSEEINSIKPLHFIIGPHIRVENYEVGEDFKKNFPNSKHFEEISGRICFNLTTSVIEQLSSNYPGTIIDDCKLDTYDHSSLRSYRRGDETKRNWNILKYN
jgi:YfiH family protein